MILTNEEFKVHSKVICDPVDLTEGEEIASKLFSWLKGENTGVGLAAPQLGIDKRVCIVHVDKPLWFVNPKIEESFGEIAYIEGCLSYPKQTVKTRRFKSVVVSADNLEKPILFEAGPNPRLTLECVAVQHEIDHLDGITMFDREFKFIPMKAEKKIGRNERVSIIDDSKNIKVLKYKKAKFLIDSGTWKLHNPAG